MCKKLICLVSCVLALSLAGNVYGHTYWTGAGGDHNWFTPTNWDTGLVPASDTGDARINLADGEPPVILAAEGAASGGVRLGYGTGTRGELIIEAGGVLSTNGLVIGQSSGSVGVFTLDGGTLNMTGGFNCANNNSATATININSGSVIKTGGGTSYFPQFGPLNVNIAGGTVSMPDNEWRVGHPSGTGALDMHLDGGVIEIKRFFLGRVDDTPHSLDITDGVMILADDRTEEIQGFIDDGWITAYGGTDFVSLDYGVTNPEKTTLKAAKVFMDVKPAHGSIICAGPVQLQWTLPEPQQPGGVVTCKVYFGISAEPWNEQTVVDGEALESVSVTTDLGIYYWAIDVFDSSSSTPDTAVYLSPVLKLDTTNQPPMVDAGDDVDTFPVDGERVVSLDGVVDDECGGPGPATVEWTVINEPNELNPAQISDPSVLNPTVTVKEPGTYELQLEAGDGEFTVADTMEIVLYADACEHAQHQEGFEWLAGDIDRDCEVDFLDLASLAVTWLDKNYTIE